jgi:hypothetical protein
MESKLGLWRDPENTVIRANVDGAIGTYPDRVNVICTVEIEALGRRHSLKTAIEPNAKNRALAVRRGEEIASKRPDELATINRHSSWTSGQGQAEGGAYDALRSCGF